MAVNYEQEGIGIDTMQLIRSGDEDGAIEMIKGYRDVVGLFMMVGCQKNMTKLVEFLINNKTIYKRSFEIALNSYCKTKEMRRLVQKGLDNA